MILYIFLSCRPYRRVQFLFSFLSGFICEHFSEESKVGPRITRPRNDSCFSVSFHIWYSFSVTYLFLVSFLRVISGLRCIQAVLCFLDTFFFPWKPLCEKSLDCLFWSAKSSVAPRCEHGVLAERERSPSSFGALCVQTPLLDSRYGARVP